MKEKYLFVGGKADGHMIDVPEYYSHWEVPYLSKPPIVPYDDFDKYSTPFEKELYRKIQIANGKNKKFGVFVLNSINDEDVIEIIMNNYKPKQDVELDIRIKTMKNFLEDCLSLMDQIQNHISNENLSRKIYDISMNIFRFLNIQRYKNH